MYKDNKNVSTISFFFIICHGACVFECFIKKDRTEIGP